MFELNYHVLVKIKKKTFHFNIFEKSVWTFCKVYYSENCYAIFENFYYHYVHDFVYNFINFFLVKKLFKIL